MTVSDIYIFHIRLSSLLFFPCPTQYPPFSMHVSIVQTVVFALWIYLYYFPLCTSI